MSAFVKYVISVIKPYIVYNDVHFIHCGAIRIRTENILLAKQILYQLSYSPSVIVPREGIEPSHLVCKTNTLPLHQQGNLSFSLLRCTIISLLCQILLCQVLFAIEGSVLDILPTNVTSQNSLPKSSNCTNNPFFADLEVIQP